MAQAVCHVVLDSGVATLSKLLEYAYTYVKPTYSVSIYQKCNGLANVHANDIMIPVREPNSGELKQYRL